MLSAPRKPVAESKLRVLVVDDNLDSVQSMAILIRILGHECQFAINGSAALKVASTFRPDLVLLDIALPDFNGCELAQRLKRMPELKDTRFIAVSGLPERHYRQAALEAGCAAFYGKPIDPRALEQLLAAPQLPPEG